MVKNSSFSIYHFSFVILAFIGSVSCDFVDGLHA
jgi:hypothetical protein